ncbi:MAG: diguanylate cyclase [Alphaproteobacteria bacterium]|nr:diguanylate cyclase [Alphaproteobacteria bacterium]
MVQESGKAAAPAAIAAGPSREEVMAVLAELEDAVADHIAWAQRWHRSAVCKLAPPRDVVSENAHYLCRFGAWLDLHQEDPIIGQNAFRTLDELHRTMHDNARWLAQRAWQDDRVPAEEYDALIDKINAFNSQVRRLEKAFRAALSDLDPLTGVRNRQTMMAELEREHERAVRTRQPCALVIADIDHFKQVNDRLGHRAGDRVLAEIAIFFQSHLRPYDSVFRYGGEEFLFCLPGTDSFQARPVIDRLRQNLSETTINLDDTRNVRLSCSFGVAAIERETSLATILEHADKALYAAKAGGRNRVMLWEDLAVGQAPRSASS